MPITKKTTTPPGLPKEEPMYPGAEYPDDVKVARELNPQQRVALEWKRKHAKYEKDIKNKKRQANIHGSNDPSTEAEIYNAFLELKRNEGVHDMNNATRSTLPKSPFLARRKQQEEIERRELLARVNTTTTTDPRNVNPAELELPVPTDFKIPDHQTNSSWPRANLDRGAFQYYGEFQGHGPIPNVHMSRDSYIHKAPGVGHYGPSTSTF